MAAFALFLRLTILAAWPSSSRNIAAEGPAVEAGREEAAVTLVAVPVVARPPAVQVAATVQRLVRQEEERRPGGGQPGAQGPTWET